MEIRASTADERRQTLKQALQNARDSGVVIAAAAGNSGFRTSVYPAYYPVCISVGATDQNDFLAGFRNWGPSVDVVAPGVGILSTFKDGRCVFMSGTSMAAPHVAVLAALIWSGPHGTSAAAVRNRIETKGVLLIAGFGDHPKRRIDAFAAVAP